MVKVLSPKIVILNQIGVEYIDTKLLQYLLEEDAVEHALVLGRPEHRADFARTDRDDELNYMYAPMRKEELINKCYEMLGIPGDWEKEDALERNAGEYSVMVVDDSAVFFRSIKSILEKKYTVYYANSGKKALELIPKQKPDLILLDYQMPEMSGPEIFEKIKENPDMSEIPIIFLTAVADKKKVLPALQMYPFGYIIKPIDHQELMERVECVLDWKYGID